SFHHHEVVGARMARKRLQELRFPNDVIDDVQRLVFLHLRFHGYQDEVWSDSAVRRYARDAGPLLDDLNELTRCDCTTRNERRARMLAARMDALEDRIAGRRERGGRSPWPCCSTPAWTRARSARRRPSAACWPGGPPAARSLRGAEGPHDG